MKFSIASSVFVNYAIQDAISLAARAGFDGLDIWGGRPHVYRRDFSPVELKELKARLEDSGLEVASFMPAFFRYPHSLSSPNEVVRQDSLGYMYQCMDNAVALGAGILLVVPGRSLSGQDLEDAHGRLVDSIAAVCRYARQYDIRLGIEPANKGVTDLVNTAGDALKIIEALGDPNLGAVLDTGHIHLSEETPEQAVRVLGPRLLQVHVNDNDGKRQQNLIPGEGTFDFPGFLDVLAVAGYAGFLSAELAWDYSLDPFPAVAESLKRMREMVQGG
jgi:fructoselysine 3-epimerase